MSKLYFDELERKIVKLSEFQKELKKIYKKELSFAEKVSVVFVNKPAAALFRFANSLIIAVLNSKRLNNNEFLKSIADLHEGIYKNPQTKEKYIKGTMAFAFNGCAALDPEEKFSRKLFCLTQRSVDNCQDYTRLLEKEGIVPAIKF